MSARGLDRLSFALWQRWFGQEGKGREQIHVKGITIRCQEGKRKRTDTWEGNKDPIGRTPLSRCGSGRRHVVKPLLDGFGWRRPVTRHGRSQTSSAERHAVLPEQGKAGRDSLYFLSSFGFPGWCGIGIPWLCLPVPLCERLGECERIVSARGPAATERSRSDAEQEVQCWICYFEEKKVVFFPFCFDEFCYTYDVDEISHWQS